MRLKLYCYNNFFWKPRVYSKKLRTNGGSQRIVRVILNAPLLFYYKSKMNQDSTSLLDIINENRL